MADNAQEHIDQFFTAADSSNPQVTIEFSGLRARLEDGIEWLVDRFKPDILKWSDINGLIKPLLFKIPSGREILCFIPFKNTSLAAAVPMQATSIGVLYTVLSVFKVGQRFDAFYFDDNKWTPSDQQIWIDGNVTLQFETLTLSAESKKALEAHPRATASVAPNVSSLVATPTPGLGSTQITVDHAAPRSLNEAVVSLLETQMSDLPPSNESIT